MVSDLNMFYQKILTLIKCTIILHVNMMLPKQRAVYLKQLVTSFILSQTVQELKHFTEVRNAMVHDAMYRVASFQIEVIHALLPLVSHLTNNRQNVRNRTKKERELHANSPHRADFFATLPVGTRLTRDELFRSVAGSPSGTICAPMSFDRPLYVVAQGGQGAPRVKIDKEEWYTHNLWDSFINVDVHMPVFRKVNALNVQGPTVEYLGHGRLHSRGALAPNVVCDVVVG
jgi:hypothetical protein